MLVGDTVSGAGVAKDGKISLHSGSENKTTSYVINDSQEEEGGGEGRGGGGRGEGHGPTVRFCSPSWSSKTKGITNCWLRVVFVLNVTY